MRKFIFLVCVAVMGLSVAHAQLVTDLETGLNFSGYNDVGVPGNNPGNIFSLQNNLGSNASFFIRARVTYTLAEKHNISVLIAPFTKTYKGKPKQNFNFAGENYSSLYETTAKYKFNSWRLTYRWDFVRSKHLQVGVGLTGKIRDAKISIKGKDGTGTVIESSTSNVGFVPLINFFFAWKFTQCMDFRIEGDALAAPQGRAEDVFIGWTGNISDKLKLKVGYRLLEGGADNNTVYNFALFHYIVLGLMFQI